MREIKAFKCGFCNKVIESQAKMIKHEEKCLKRPEGPIIIPSKCKGCPPMSKIKCSLDGIKDCLI